jgi:HK97 family phage major capsid protein
MAEFQKVIELRRQRANVANQMKSLLEGAEKRNLNAEEQQQFDRMDKEAEELRGQIERLEKFEDLNNSH